MGAGRADEGRTRGVSSLRGAGPRGGAKSRIWRRSGCGAVLSRLSSCAACCSGGESRGSLSRSRAPGVQRPLEHSVVRRDVVLSHLRLQSLPGCRRPSRRVQMLLPGWVELRRRGPTEPGRCEARRPQISRGPGLCGMQIVTVLLLQVTRRPG